MFLKRETATNEIESVMISAQAHAIAHELLNKDTPFVLCVFEKEGVRVARLGNDNHMMVAVDAIINMVVDDKMNPEQPKGEM